MNKLGLLILLCVTQVVWADSLLNAQLEGLENLTVGELRNCASVETETSYTPQEALKDINSGKLTYLGRDLFPGKDQNRTCVYKSDRAYILYNNCMANKKESTVTDIQVISFNGGIASFYIEQATATAAVSELPRSKYDSSWTVDYGPSPAPGSLTLSQLKAYMEKNDRPGNGCFIGGAFKAKKLDTKAQCSSGAKGASEWKKKAQAFWLNPDPDWLATKRYLRKTVVDTKI